MLVLVTAFVASATAVSINFGNCLSPNTINSDSPRLLQFSPLFVNVRFNTTDQSHNLNVTIHGNVSGQATEGDYPPPDSPSWTDPESPFGKIVNVSTQNNKLSTLFSTFRVLQYTAYKAPASEFCRSTINQPCPIGPAFSGNASDPSTLPGFTVSHDFYSSYAFATFAATILVQSGDEGAPNLACVTANITPDLGSRLSNSLTYLPAAVLALVGIATVAAAILSPWGSSNPLRWTSNYGRDEDLLRLVTPGFGDCLQYIQFAVLTGSLTLNYPGYFQPVVSKASWAVLMFNHSFVSRGDGYQSLVDGIYFANATRGLSRMRQYVGMSEDEDIWAGMAVWLLCILAAVMVLCQLGFFFRWGYRQLSNTQESDLRSKNLPFTVGNVIRVVINFFLLPIMALSMFQLVVSSSSPAFVVATAVVLIVITMILAIWVLRRIFATKPRAHLYDDLPTVLLYGPLYNTYSDDAAPFALIPVLLTFIRGIAIGAVQPSGVAQLVLLAICEVIFILTLHAFRPFPGATFMNAYHTFFSVIRLATTLLSVAFVPSLEVSEAPKGWIGYGILLLHAFVLVFGFFLNSIQTLIEIGARLAGAGGEARGPLTKVFGVRQLSRRARRHQPRSSLNSEAAMLASDDTKAIQMMGGRSRSLSASSAILLHQQLADQRMSSGFDRSSQGGDVSTSTPGTPGHQTPYSFAPSSNASAGPSSRRPVVAVKTGEAVDPYYRPPRARRLTLETMTPGARSRGSHGSWGSAAWTSRVHEDSPEDLEAKDGGDGYSATAQGAPVPAYLRSIKDESETNINEPGGPRTDYAVREVDFYYGVRRGPALSDLPTRRLKTGPADPTGSVSTATGWLKGLFGGKTKEKGKGFEVVRSTRAPPPIASYEDEVGSPEMPNEPYRDNPEPQPADARQQQQQQQEQPVDDGDDQGTPTVVGARGSISGVSSLSSDDASIASYTKPHHRTSDLPPTLEPIDTGDGIELPSRIGSRYSTAARSTRSRAQSPPKIPRKSSKRPVSIDKNRIAAGGPRRLSDISSTSPSRSSRSRIPAFADDRLRPSTAASSTRLPFGTDPSPDRLSTTGTPGGGSGASSLTPGTENIMDPSVPREPGLSAGSHALTAPPGSDRPLSTGFVQQHRAGESIRPAIYGSNSHLGASAEVVDGGIRRSSSTGRSEGRVGRRGER